MGQNAKATNDIITCSAQARICGRVVEVARRQVKQTAPLIDFSSQPRTTAGNSPDHALVRLRPHFEPSSAPRHSRRAAEKERAYNPVPEADYRRMSAASRQLMAEAAAASPAMERRRMPFITLSDLFNTVLRGAHLSDSDLSVRCPRCRRETTLAACPIAGRRQTTYTCPACHARLVQMTPLQDRSLQRVCAVAHELQHPALSQ